MTTTWQALLWKEWRERRWLVFTLVAVVIAVLPLGFTEVAEWGELPAVLAGVTSVCLVLSLPLVSIFLGASIAASEQSNATINFLQSLPLKPSKAALIKLLVALGPIWLPSGLLVIAVRALEAAGLTPDLPSEPPLELIAAQYCLACTSLLLWIAAAGVNQSDEVRAGAVGLLVMLGSLAVIGVLADALQVQIFIESLMAIHPLGLWIHSTEGNWRPLHISLALISHTALALWYITRFGRVSHRRGLSEPIPMDAKSPFTWLAPPRRSPLTAILWKQMRESLPLAALGAGSIFAITILFFLGARMEGDALDGSRAANFLTATWVMTGFFVAIVAGIGLFMDDLRPQLHTFWRSRPINPDQWFAWKFFPALAATILTMALPVLVVLLVLASLGVSTVFGSEGRRVGLIVLAGYGVLGQSAAFCLAAAAMAVVRRPVVAAVIAIGAAIVMAVTFERMGNANSPPLLAALLSVAAAVPATAAAWLAIRYDWGWKA